MRVLSTPSRAVWCKKGGFTPHQLTYDGNSDGVPDNVTSTGHSITITPTDLSFHECDSKVKYVLKKEISGVSIDPNTAVISIDCTIASQKSCNLTILVDTVCKKTVIGTRSINIVLTCGDCADAKAPKPEAKPKPPKEAPKPPKEAPKPPEQAPTNLDYDSDNNGVPDTVAMYGDRIEVVPISLTTGQCGENVTYELAKPIDGVTVDQNTAVVLIDCAKLKYKDCGAEITVNAMCTGIAIQSSKFRAPTDGCQNCRGMG